MADRIAERIASIRQRVEARQRAEAEAEQRLAERYQRGYSLASRVHGRLHELRGLDAVGPGGREGVLRLEFDNGYILLRIDFGDYDYLDLLRLDVRADDERAWLEHDDTEISEEIAAEMMLDMAERSART